MRKMILFLSAICLMFSIFAFGQDANYYWHRNKQIPLRSDVPLTSNFYVKLKDRSDYNLLVLLANEQNCRILREVKYMPLWYALMPNNKETEKTTLDLANYFYETGYFSAIDPGFMIRFKSSSTSCKGINEPKFSEQWNLEHINMCGAWNFTKGNSSIKVAVFDAGIELEHIEFSGVPTISYDALVDDTIARIYESHGTLVAGVIFAQHNDTMMAGIAPNVSLINVAHNFDPFFPFGPSDNFSEQLANGISWAVANGADVLNCSWGSIDPEILEVMQSELLEDAILYALDSGRGGLGTVVVFAAGNDKEKGINYPAYFDPRILVVGGTDANKMRAYKSSYGGNSLDIVAPCTPMTTGRNNVVGFIECGTSFAAPAVVGAAALMLSVNPYLSRQEVKNIIELTAQKLPGYQFKDTLGRQNWNIEIGAGLLDICRAVVMALTVTGSNLVYITLKAGSSNTFDTLYAISVDCDGIVSTSLPDTIKYIDKDKDSVEKCLKEGTSIYFPPEMSMLDSAVWFINGDSVFAGTIKFASDSGDYYFPLWDFSPLWVNPSYNSNYITVEAKLPDGTKFSFRFRIGHCGDCEAIRLDLNCVGGVTPFGNWPWPDVSVGFTQKDSMTVKTIRYGIHICNADNNSIKNIRVKELPPYSSIFDSAKVDLETGKVDVFFTCNSDQYAHLTFPLEICVDFEDGTCCKIYDVSLICGGNVIVLPQFVIPNPVNDMATIGYEIVGMQEGMPLKIYIYDTQGNLVLIVMDAVPTSAIDKIHISTSNLPPGRYYVVFYYGDFVNSTSFIKQ